ncbi:hypothetical protein CMQ_4751 [Grosmannia clavigera kw1407]|uniref:Asl1-like glycosyl hydrolase catalytic domain-containing protein n=1 Tax=Grosmannia clavigera (strain kw1407 / UAMH 11150) TaxID=655863 RepID=F0XTP6_GROCL|nr:uncharacterized protein CMQ_4751 [Grosmannia clavigera kw1407]EFW98899.1 hypothetical protein CMQ_4751 [Grosmannia clavigera kw1407]
MLNNKQVLAIVAALFTQEALALNVHRHVHNHVHDKRAVVYQETDVVTVTDWSTVTVWEEFSETTQKTMFKGGAHTHHTSSTITSSSSISTSSSVKPSTSSVVPTASSVVPTTSSTSTSSSISTPSPTTFSTSSVAPVPTTSSTSSTVAPVPTTLSVAAAVSSVINKADALIETPTTTSVAPVPTTTAAAAVATVVSTTTSSVAKRGLAYNTGSLLSNFLGTGSKCTWSYNWGKEADSSAPSDIEFVPMLWSPNDYNGWDTAAEKAIAGGSKYFLSFNECDNAGQCNTDAATAATAHQKYMNPYSGRVKIGTPAITNSNLEGAGISWLANFLSACNGNCDFDFCPLHWYNTADTNDFLTHLINAHETCGKDIWITEFAPTGSDDEINSFLIDVMDQMDNNATFSFVQRYAYFWAATGSLLTSETSLSTYGSTFAYQ